MLEPVELNRGELRPVREPLHGRQAGAAFQAGREPLGEQLRPGDCGDPRGCDEATLTQGFTAEQNPGPAAAPDCLRDGFDGLSGDRR